MLFVFYTIGCCLSYNPLIGITGNIDNADHIGGLISGFIVGAGMSFIAVITHVSLPPSTKAQHSFSLVQKNYLACREN
jgi:fructose-specific phosphotransferase system IIC component